MDYSGANQNVHIVLNCISIIDDRKINEQNKSSVAGLLYIEMIEN